MQAEQPIRFGREVIKQLLPQRPPWLLIDAVEHFTPGPRPSLRASRSIRQDEPWVASHFPGMPVLPGALLIEGLAQAGALLLTLIEANANGDKPWLQRAIERRQSGVGLLAASHIKFRHPVSPGQQLDYEVQQMRQLDALCRVRAHAWVKNQCVAEGHLDLAWKPKASRPFLLARDNR